MNSEDISALLNTKSIKPTPNRILVLKELVSATRPVNLADLENKLSPMDKASIFRVLDLFVEKEMIHVIDDGTRSFKYELCRSRTHHTFSDQHVHFCCNNCKRIFCLENVALPVIPVPDGFKTLSGNFILKGLCSKCNLAPS